MLSIILLDMYKRYEARNRLYGDAVDERHLLDDMYIREPSSFGVAMRNLRSDVIETTKYKNEVLRRQLYDHVHPHIQQFTKEFLAETKAYGIPLLPFELYRTPERQSELYSTGVTKAKPWESPHQFGCAVDLVHAVKYWKLTDAEWRLMGAIGKEIARRLNIKMTWGGDWDFYDPAHWELTNFRDYRKAYMDRGNKILLPDFDFFRSVNPKLNRA